LAKTLSVGSSGVRVDVRSLPSGIRESAEDVRYWRNNGPDLLMLSFSHFDPSRKSRLDALIGALFFPKFAGLLTVGKI
jgi:hypothetical protein